jgi:Cof subfamily protein (haloacid dehalogenase superfamily)
LVIDIDGTLLDKQGNISDIDTKALAKARAAGVRVSLSTGRAAEACKKVLKQLGLDGYHIFFDGALVYNPETGEEVYADPIDKDLVRQIAEYLHKVPMNMDLYSANRYFVERETWATEIRRTFFGLQPNLVDFTKLWQQERIIKGTLVVASPEEKARVNDFYLQFKDRLSFSWTGTPAYPAIDFINVIALDVSKGVALKALTDFLGVSLAETVAIGDGANDIPLLTSAGLAIAVGNASAELKAVADYVTLDVDHQGVAAAIEKYLL